MTPARSVIDSEEQKGELRKRERRGNPPLHRAARSPLPKNDMKMKKTVAAVLAAAMALSAGATTAFAVGYDASGLADSDWQTAFYSVTYDTSDANTAKKATVSGSDNSNLSTTVTYAVTEGYEWTIHSAINFGKDKRDEKDATAGATIEKTGNNVNVTKNRIKKGKKLRITVKGTYKNTSNVDTEGFKVATAEGETLDYAITSDSHANAYTAVDTDPVLTVDAGTDTGAVALTYTLTTTSDNAETAGTYSGTVTYTAAIVNQ